MGGEEKDFFMRVRAQGIRYYYVPGAEIYHITPASKLTRAYFERLIPDDRRQRAGAHPLRRGRFVPETSVGRGGQMGRGLRIRIRLPVPPAAAERVVPASDAVEYYLRSVDR